MSMSIADHLRSYSQAYPIDIFPECDREELKQLHIDYPNMSARIFAESGRTFAKQALEGANELDRQEQKIEKLEQQRDKCLEMLREIRPAVLEAKSYYMHDSTCASVDEQYIIRIDKLIAECEGKDE